MMTWKQATMGFRAMTKVGRTFHQKKDPEASTAARPSAGGTYGEVFLKIKDGIVIT